MNIPIPSNEKRRLEVLWKYDVLDTPPDASLDDLTELAASICQTPIAMVSLVDQERQWFKARVGLALTETPRDISFCTHAILQPDVMVVRDALLDPRFKSSPLVTGDPYIRFYAGAPLTTSEGLALGTLCVADRVPRVLDSKQSEALRKLARVIVQFLELRRQVKELSAVPIRQRSSVS
ncbi:MAG: GAF domain-containing protein [Verrucomicrobia bacterium]|nr:GAF domain-containing protein [Verrucomicrobiota bacterium]